MGSAVIKNKGRLLRLFTLALIYCLVLAPCARADFTLNDELELGKQFNVLIRSQMPLVQDPEVLAYMEHLLSRLTEHMPPQPVPFQINVIRDNTLNAFAVPGGYIFVHSGLILAMANEAELAGVLSHEMAHVTQRHIAGRIAKAQSLSALALAGALAGILVGAVSGSEAGMGLAVGGMAASQSAMLSYSRADESEADQVGMNYYLAAGYPPEGMVDSFRVIQRPQWETGGTIPTYLSTHPDIPSRIADLSARISTMRVPQKNLRPVDNAQFLRVQTLLRGRYGNTEAANKFFNNQLASGDKALAWLGLGILNERRNRIADATKAFDTAIKLRPGDQLFLREAGRFNYLKGDKSKAMNLLQQATAQNPEDFLALFYYARLLDDYGQSRLALNYYARVLRLEPEDAEAHEYYARALGREKELFSAYLHLAYSALYSNNQRRTEQSHAKARELAKSELEKSDLAAFERKYAERKTFWKQ